MDAQNNGLEELECLKTSLTDKQYEELSDKCGKLVFLRSDDILPEHRSFGNKIEASDGTIRTLTIRVAVFDGFAIVTKMLLSPPLKIMKSLEVPK